MKRIEEYEVYRCSTQARADEIRACIRGLPRQPKAAGCTLGIPLETDGKGGIYWIADQNLSGNTCATIARRVAALAKACDNLLNSL